ncbi:MAG: heme-dependent peroxidase, partial [Candidatus Eremiobacteraeota bacterium]|nr:heme-dependent peroxidase [Candidatus Eremiobacteraeota bacterium]
MSENRPPSTLEGAFMLHQLLAVDWPAWNALDEEARAEIMAQARPVLEDLCQRKERDEASAYYRVLGHKGDLMMVHLRHTPEEINAVERKLTSLDLWTYLTDTYSYVSVVELSLHGAAERYRKTLQKQGLEEDTPEWEEALEKLLEGDRQTQRARLYPEIPADKYLCFYPMNKLRGEHKNWFMLTPAQRGEMMKGHGKTGRKYFGKVTQIISSSMGFDDFDWGVDLFSEDAVQFKKLIYEMRFDEVSAIYAEFGPFFLGIRTPAAE